MPEATFAEVPTQSSTGALVFDALTTGFPKTSMVMGETVCEMEVAL
jgi:hypothetical protein